MIRSYSRRFAQRNIALAFLAIAGAFLSGCGGLGSASKTPQANPHRFRHHSISSLSWFDKLTMRFPLFLMLKADSVSSAP